MGERLGDMRNDYCYRCGFYVQVDDLTRMCDTCYRGWLDRRPRRS
jgi:hypothetical protein